MQRALPPLSAGGIHADEYDIVIFLIVLLVAAFPYVVAILNFARMSHLDHRLDWLEREVGRQHSALDQIAARLRDTARPAPPPADAPQAARPLATQPSVVAPGPFGEPGQASCQTGAVAPGGAS